ncbi:UDP-4-amino-4-deoxy-L-arabinose--oxoglutarate aminotransferase [Salmonella enterica subsp. enterica]|uniref:UDP-4-amino-4-deoxy-L-arabinose--oxoglutarate aminotransferase n=1 Tax=Salmonella enterica I TaxID=59201 RepID=A0A379UV16_SALET|nr:UDP-4-amino-4-deoxy-L-arabinose--oxoglutarate aminotransferase [Salmonella enterica subsp. enterica]
MSDFLPFSRPAMGAEELAAVKTVLDSGWITTGPKNQELEAAFCRLTGNQYAVAVSSATAGMHIALMALGIGEGDEVITPSMTWVSTLNMIVLLGATPVMVDVDRDTLMVTPEHIEAAITPQTKAIIPVHYAGAPADLDAIYALGERYGIPVIEDAAHADRNQLQRSPHWRPGAPRFSPSTPLRTLPALKAVSSSRITRNSPIKLRSLKFHGLALMPGIDRAEDARHKRKSWRRATNIICPTSTPLSRLLSYRNWIALNARRAAIAAQYHQAMADLPFQPLSLPSWEHIHAWHLFIIRVDEARCGITRDALMASLKTKGIGTGLHFRAAHTQKYYRERFPTLTLPDTEWNSERICSLRSSRT